MSEKTRVYIPLLLDDLAGKWPSLTQVRGVFLNEAGATLRGDDLEEAEWIALMTALALLSADALDQRQPRAVLAADLPRPTGATPLDGHCQLGIFERVEPAQVVSVHIDPTEVRAALAVLAAADQDGSGVATAQKNAHDQLVAANLLWYDISEIDQVLSG